MGTLLALMLVLLAAFLLWGVGTAVQRPASGKASGHAAAVGIGLAVVVFAGGILNLAHLAFAPALWALAGIALVVSAIELMRLNLRFSGGLKGNGDVLVAGTIILGVTLSAISTQLPPRAFNFHDDLQKYFAHPVRMLETGTLAGSTLSALGAETLGGQAFLHGFVLSICPIGYINGVDAIFGLFALMLLTAAAGRRRYVWFFGVLLGPLLVATINPQYVNVSGLYIGSLLMATAILLVAEDREGAAPAPFLIGLIYAALIAIKSTFALFAMLHLGFATLALRGTLGSWWAASKWKLRTGMWTLIALLPWTMLYLPNDLAHGNLPRIAVPGGDDGALHIFSFEPVIYGASFGHYALIALITAALAGVSIYSLRKSSDPKQKKTILGISGGGMAGVLSYLILLVGLGRALNGYDTNLRYTIPFLLGTCVIFLAMAPALFPGRPKWMSCYIPLLASLLIAASFVPSMIARYQQAAQFGSILAFSRLAELPDYLSYNQYCLSEAAKTYVRGFQEKVPEGETLVAWINTPYLLNYKRNKIIDADTVGISARWARIPSNAHYVLWQFQGLGVRSGKEYLDDLRGPGAHERNVAAQSFAFTKYLAHTAAASKVIAADNQFVLFELSPQNTN
jgi:hypothetical protein